MPYLLKTEPDCYAFSDLKRDRETVWDGVTNSQAVKYLREMKPRERLVIYHTGTERQAVGTAKVLAVDSSDPKTPKVRISARSAIAAKTLAAIKTEKLFYNSPLLRQGRLSVVPLTEEQYAWLISE